MPQSIPLTLQALAQGNHPRRLLSSTVFDAFAGRDGFVTAKPVQIPGLTCLLRFGHSQANKRGAPDSACTTLPHLHNLLHKSLKFLEKLFKINYLVNTGGT